MDLFEEIREDIIKTKYIHLWRKYGKFAIIISLLSILLLSIYFFTHEKNNNKNVQNTEKLYNIIQSKKTANYTDLLSIMNDLIEDSSKNHQSYATLKKIDYEISNNNIASAYNLLMNLYNNKSIYKPYQDYAELLLNYIIFKYPTEEKFDMQIINNITSDNIFYYNILEIRALCYIEQNDINSAKNELLKILNEPDVPQAIKSFTTELLGLLRSQN